MNIESRLLKDIVPYAKNLRKIPQKAIDKVALSIAEFGPRQPIVVDAAGVTVVGSVRYMACKKLGLDSFPVHVAEGLTPAQVQGYRIADNRSHEETDWDLDIVKLEINELDALKFDLKFTGFEPREIDECLADPVDDEAENASPAPPAKAVSRPGDLWLCGPHRVLDGDATNPEHVTRVLGDLRPPLMTTDAPYGVSLNPLWRQEAGLGTVVQTGKIANDDRVDWSQAYALFPGDVAFIWHAGIHSGPVAAGIHNAFVVPSSGSIAAWRPVVDALFRGNYLTAANLAAPLNYNVIQFTDTGRNRTYYILVERTNSANAPINGLGTYVFNPTACRNLSFQAPHAGGDENTLPEAATLFADLNATALMVAGTHRCANSTVSTCDGQSAACGDSNFHVSDVAHYTQNYFEPAHEEILKTIPGLITVAVHGEGVHTPDAIISNGTCFNYPSPSAATLLSNEYNHLFQQLGFALSSGTCNLAAASTTLCAETDVQGRYSNNSAMLCNCESPTVSACSTTLGCGRNITFPEKFVHLEQDCQLRQVTGCAVPGVGYQTAVSAFAAVFPCSPQISSVVQGASFKADPLAPGSFFTLFGDGVGTAATATAASFALGGLSMEFCGQPARLVYNSGQGQVNGVVPVEVAGKASCELTAILGGYTVPATPATTTVQIVPQNVALFLYAQNSTTTLPIITNLSYQIIGAPSSGLAQAQKGGSIILWATGGGLTTPVVADGAATPAPGAPMQTTPTVQIAGVAATVEYAGLAPGFIGLYQLNVAVPTNTPSGQVSLTLSSGIGNVSYSLWVQ